MSRSHSRKPRSGDAHSRHHGLVNQGATCYLNSVLQVLFMTKGFREALERSGKSAEKPIDADLKALFEELKRGRADTQRITRRLNVDGVHQQQDVAEIFERILHMASPRAAQVFRGGLTHIMECQRCSKESFQKQEFCYLPLSVGGDSTDPYRVVDGIEEYFRESTFTGENQVYCKDCAVKADCTERKEVNHLPDVLTLLLKRFHVNYQTMSKAKNRRVVSIPYTVDIPKPPALILTCRASSDHRQPYQLYAVIEYSGDLRRGHYTAVIQTQDGGQDAWFRFDDDKVSLLPQQPFDDCHPIARFSQAYLLFYGKKRDIKPKHAQDEPSAEVHHEAHGFNTDLGPGTQKSRGNVHGHDAAVSSEDRQSRERQRGPKCEEEGRKVRVDKGKCFQKIDPLIQDQEFYKEREMKTNEEQKVNRSVLSAMHVHHGVSKTQGDTQTCSKRDCEKKKGMALGEHSSHRRDQNKVVEQKRGDKRQGAEAAGGKATDRVASKPPLTKHDLIHQNHREPVKIRNQTIL